MQYEDVTFDLPGIQPFRFFINYGEGEGVYDHPDQHFHPELELYVHLEGNVSFMVEDTVYPVRRGNIVLSRPYEYHHCIYHDTSLHRHYWILISCDGNSGLFAPLSALGSRIVLSEENSRRLIGVCRTLYEKTEADAVERYHLFFRLLALLRSGTADGEDADLPADVLHAMAFIDAHMHTPLSVRQMAEAAHTSVNTLERHFRAALGITPYEFLRVRRLARARELLGQGLSVQEVSDACGFPDYSHFISLFRRRFGMTPLQYRRMQVGT